MKSTTCAKQGGVGTLVRDRHQGAHSPRTALGEELFDPGRWNSVVVKVNRGSALLHVVTIYGLPGVSDG